MKVSTSPGFFSKLTVCAAVLSVIQCHFTTSTTMSTLQRSLYGDFLHLDSAPDTVTANSTVQVSYTCSRACRVGIEIVLSTTKTDGLVTFRRSWTHVKQLNQTRTRTVQLTFPPAVVYKRDYFFRRTVEAHDVTLRAWLVHLDGAESNSSHVGVGQYERSVVRLFKTLQMVPPSERPAKSPSGCIAWGAELTWNQTKDRIEKCSPESDIVRLLTFPFASTGEKYGIIRTFPDFANRELAIARLRALEKPRLTVSVWLYLLNWCEEKLCGIIKHVNEHRKYATPLLLLTNTGSIMVQVRLTSGLEQAFTAHTDLPLWTWIRVDLFVQTSEAKLIITQANLEDSLMEASYSFQDTVLYNDTSGFFVIGGSIYMPGIQGYVGPVKYYRLGSDTVVNPLTPERTLQELNEAHRHCEDLKQITEAYVKALQDSRASLANDVCVSYYELSRRTFGQTRCMQTWSWDHQMKYRAALKTLRRHEEELMSGPWSSKKASLFGQRLYQDVVKRLADAGLGDIDTSLVELLQLCSCWGHHQASLMLATLHLSGLGVPADQEKGHVYSLMGGVRDERLALLHLGYKHMQGLDGFPKDLDMAYGYYANMGKQTIIDHNKVQDSEQALIEHVRLTNPKDLQMQAGESDDIIQFLIHQAERGDIESQKTLARMSFYGSNGMRKDISTALSWYARSAMQMTDAVAMYDYSILLLKGIGGKKNQTLALKLLKKAADMGYADALNALGWYHGTMGKNNTKAAYYFVLAARNGSREGMFNLGVYHLNGAIPDSSGKNETAAFQCFLKAGELGHADGAVEAASSLSQGHLPGVRRDPEKAVTLLKLISEKNGHLGFTVRDALKAFQHGSWDEALLKYAVLAETGFVVAQINAAHLCEVMEHDSTCQWRYHNYSTYNHAPYESGLLKMGDHYIVVGDMEKAIALYSRAALRGSAQGMYNLAVLTDEGHDIPAHVLEQMKISTAPQLDKSAAVEKLLLRCRELEGKGEEMSPCSLALFGLRVARTWCSFTHSTVYLALTLTTLVMFVLAVVTQSALARYCAAALPRSIPNQSSPEQSESPRLSRVRGSDSDTAANQERPSRVTRAMVIAQTYASRHFLSLQEAADLVITVTGVCVCALCTMFVSHLL
ncbi:protein sel-1 homolog 3 [Ictalurus furcatus]|uniref:protein sel-1 homolog 3 n=1 Tax=Ictalurus furcatus TaxID=66913 RepID=UPI00234FF05D|nr:protein sel-1 homolog 3 [Ictalurus furcatus]